MVLWSATILRSGAEVAAAVTTLLLRKGEASCNKAGEEKGVKFELHLNDVSFLRELSR